MIPSVPDFANTITALERSGKLLSKVAAVFYDLVSAHSNPAILEIDKEVSLRMARHWNPIMMNAVLFGRIAHAAREPRQRSASPAEELRLLERTYTRFHRAGAGLDEAAKARMAEINERLAHLGTTFSHHLLGDEQEWFMELGEDDRAGLPDSFRRRRQGRGGRTRHGRQGDRDAVALLGGAVPEELGPPRPARKGVSSAFTARGDNGNANDNNADHRRDPRAARGERKNPGFSDLSPPTGSRIPWRRRRTRCAACWSGSGSRPGRGRSPTAMPCRR